jgi:hypothetical protein
MGADTDTNWFFVLHLEEKDRPSNGAPYEIQVLNANGQAVACGYADEQTDHLQLQGCSIPLAVIGAARRQAVGKGDYVNEAGDSVPAF